MNAKQKITLTAACLLIAPGLGNFASGQGVTSTASGSAAPVLQQQPQQKVKPGRGHGPQAKPATELTTNQQQLRNQNLNRNHLRHQGQAQSNGPAHLDNNQLRTPAPKYAEALKRYRHERHDRFWWKQRYTVIVLVGSGYYYWDAGYWCPAWGYDSNYETYDYDGPIYTYGDLLPDQVIVNVQRALKQLGYYNGGLTGSLGPASRQALANYQADAGLDVTGAIDAATVEALGLVD